MEIQEQGQSEKQLIGLIFPMVQRGNPQELEEKLQYFKDIHDNDPEIINPGLLKGYDVCRKRCENILESLQIGAYSENIYLAQLKMANRYIYTMEKFSREMKEFGYFFDDGSLEKLKQTYKKLSKTNI